MNGHQEKGAGHGGTSFVAQIGDAKVAFRSVTFDDEKVTGGQVAEAAGAHPVEIQANAFASELLMPAQLVRKVLSESQRDLNDDEYLIALAKRFRVSLTAFQFRLEKL